MTRVSVDVDTDDIREDRTADSRGRVSLGPEYAGETVTVAVVEREGGSELADEVYHQALAAHGAGFEDAAETLRQAADILSGDETEAYE